MLDGILNNRLKGQRRNSEIFMLYIVLNKKAVLILSLFNGKICECVFQLRRKCNRLCARYGCKVLAKVRCEIHDDLPGKLWVLATEAVYARHCVVDEVRPHLKHHDIRALVGDFTLPLQVLLYLVGQYEAVH